MKNFNPIDLSSAATVTLLFSDGNGMPLGGLAVPCNLRKADTVTADFIFDAAGRFGPIALLEFGMRFTRYEIGDHTKRTPRRARLQKRTKRTKAPRKK